MLTRIAIPSAVSDAAVSAFWTSRIAHVLERVRTFQDRWDQPQIEQFVAADYTLVYQTLEHVRNHEPLINQRFLEWGCGFAAVSAMAASMGFDAVGIEAESDLLIQGERTIAQWGEPVELVRGNFLPEGAESIAEDPTLPSLGHPLPSAYERIGLDLDDFGIVYSYPWPGEDDFHEAVFDRYGNVGALLMMFCGPNDVRVYRKTAKNKSRTT